jgi:hypothetical protein
VADAVIEATSSLTEPIAKGRNTTGAVPWWCSPAHKAEKR